MRVAVAQLAHETNRFSAVPTDLAAFAASGLAVGPAALVGMRGTEGSVAGFLTGADEHGLDLVPLLSVWATPSGLVTAAAIAHLEGLLLDGLRRALADGPLAGVLLALHGAMVTETDDDGDARVLDVVRAAVGPGVPIVATLDLHANLSPRMVRAADLLVGYDTYPHTDMAERAHEACGLLARLARREVRPTAALRRPPMLPTSQRMTTDRDPMRALVAHAHAIEAVSGVLNASVFGGFPPADVVDAGLAVLVTTDGDPALAARLADELAAAAWARRAGFLGGVSTFAEAAAALTALPPAGPDGAPADGRGPLLLVDIGDNPWTGGPGDSADLVRFLLAERVVGAAVALVRDPDTVGIAQTAGVGATIAVALGGKTDRLHGPPLPLRATVLRLSDGRYVNDGPMMAGLPVDLGPSALLACRPPHDDAPPVEVLVTTRAETPIALAVFRAHGIEPTCRRVLALKGKGHFRAAFAPIARQTVLVEGPGITGADLSRLPLARVRRPIWPLDEGVRWAPGATTQSEFG